MEWYVTNRIIVAVIDGKRLPDHGFITFDQFNILTGKKIDWTTRNGKYIVINRNRSRTIIRDKYFIPGEYYRLKRKVYKCEHVNADGTALLTPRGNALKAMVARDTNDWEIT